MKPIDRRPLVETVPEEEGGYNTIPDLHTCATLNEGDRTFITFIDFGSEAIGASSTVLQQLVQKATEFSPTKSFKDLIPKPYQEFKNVFAKESFDQLPPRKPWDHEIKLTPGAEPFSTKVYPMSPVEQKELDAFLKENLKSHHIYPSKSPMGSPFFFIKKKDGSL